MCMYICVCGSVYVHTPHRDRWDRGNQFWSSSCLCVCHTCAYHSSLENIPNAIYGRSFRKLNSHFLANRNPVSLALKLFLIKKKIHPVLCEQGAITSAHFWFTIREYTLLRYKLQRTRACHNHFIYCAKSQKTNILQIKFRKWWFNLRAIFKVIKPYYPVLFFPHLKHNNQ